MPLENLTVKYDETQRAIVISDGDKTHSFKKAPSWDNLSPGMIALQIASELWDKSQIALLGDASTRVIQILVALKGGRVPANTESEETPNYTLTEEELREAEEENRKRAAQSLRQQPIMDQRRRNGQCINCGERLGLFERLSLRNAHKRCTSFRD